MIYLDHIWQAFMRPCACRRNIYCMPNLKKKDAGEKHADEIIMTSIVSLSLQRNNKVLCVHWVG
jgi:hypothetical protein